MTPPQVDAGQDLDAYNAQHAGETDFTPVKPIDFEPTTQKAQVAFMAPQPGYYALAASSSLATDPDTWTVGSAWVHVTDTTEPVVLTETTAGTVKFFAILWSETDPE